MMNSIQVSSFLKADRARVEKARLEEQFDRPAYVVEVEIKGKNWFRVHGGRFDTKEEALKTAVGYREKGWVDYFRVRKLVETEGRILAE